MPRLTWLATELRAAGLRVVEVDGWKTRGSSDFSPVGVTWHATAGSRNATAQGEVNVILRGSSTAPPPIAQIMLWRDGTIYLCAAGRCNHNKVGWAGPNKGLGNTKLLGIEMANDNKGEPWPEVQLDAARRATAVIMRKLGANPLKRLAAHYEHQPYAGRPPGEGSTKSDPAGVDMKAERPRVAALMTGDSDMPLTKTDGELVWKTDIIPNPAFRADAKTNPATTAFYAMGDIWRRVGAIETAVAGLAAQLKTLTGRDFVDERAIAAAVLAGISPEAIAAAIPTDIAEQVAQNLAGRLAA